MSDKGLKIRVVILMTAQSVIADRINLNDLPLKYTLIAYSVVIKGLEKFATAGGML
jgi:hypothetical protein